MLLCFTTHSDVLPISAVILTIAVTRQRLDHKQHVPALFKNKNDRDMGVGQKDTESEGVVSEEAVVQM